MGPRLSAGKKVKAPTIRITPTSNTLNKGVVTGNVPSDGGEIASNSQHGNDHEEPPHQHGYCARRVVPKSISVQASEGRTVIACHGREGVQDLCQAMRTGIGDAGCAKSLHGRDRRKHENHKRKN
jgi:hypothetical protein